jgi:hypothetical protein
MTRNSVLRASIVLDPQVAPLLARFRRTWAHPTDDDVRALARQLRSLRPAWRAVALTTTTSADGDDWHPEWRREGGDLLRVDAGIVSRVPLIDGSAYSVDDARTKLEALSNALRGEVVGLEIRIYPTALACDRTLLPVYSRWPHWFCVCGAVSLDELAACANCGRARAPLVADPEPIVAAAA